MTQLEYMNLVSPLVSKTVVFFIQKGFLSSNDYDSINRELLNILKVNQATYTSQYSNNSLFSTYITEIIINHCQSLVKEKKEGKNTVFTYNYPLTSENETKPGYSLENEFKKLDLFFTLSKKKKHRLILCLKLIFRLPVSLENIMAYDRQMAKDHINTFLRLSHYSRVAVTDKYIFFELVSIINKSEGQVFTVDSLQAWVDTSTNNLIRFLNESHSFELYSKDKLKLLLEKYFSLNILN